MMPVPAHTPGWFPVIYGPTASGKSALALRLARALRDRHARRAELVTCDAFQLYTSMDIGTAKPTRDERAEFAHHLLDELDPHATATFSVEDWLRRARATIEEVRARDAVPIVVGGTSLYVQALRRGLFDGPGADEALRAELRAMGAPALRAELERVDPDAARRIHPSDERRTVRALEVYRLTGVAISTLQRQWETAAGAQDATPDAAGSRAGTEAATGPVAGARLVVLSWETPELNRRINARVREMVSRGLVDEVRSLLARGPLNAQAREALGYKQLLPLLSEEVLDTGVRRGRAAREEALEEAIEQIKIQTRRFAKNQRTWMKRFGADPQAVQMPMPIDDATLDDWCARAAESLARR
jgi:tRNA dimethylallyltransferase